MMNKPLSIAYKPFRAMKANTNKERSFYTQVQQFAARVLFILWLLASVSPEGTLAAPKGQSAMTPATTTNPGDPSLASVPPLPGGTLQLPPDAPGSFWGSSVASSPSTEAGLQRAQGLRAKTLDKLVGRFWGPRGQEAPRTLAGPVAEGITEGASSAVVASRTATPTLEELMSREEVPDNKTLVLALNAAPSQEQRRWIEKAVEWFDGRSIATLYPAAIRDYAALAHIQVTPANSELLKRYLHSLCNKVKEGPFGEELLIQALAYVLAHLDPDIFAGDPTPLRALADSLLKKLDPSKRDFSEDDYRSARPTLEALSQTLLLLKKVAPRSFIVREGSLYQSFRGRMKAIADRAQYYPVRYHAQFLKQTLELLAKIKDVSTRQQVWKGCQAVLHGLEGGFYFYQGINKLIPFSSLEALSNLSTIPFKSSYSAFTKSYAIIKEILPKLDREANHWYSYLLQIYDYSAQLLAGDASSCDRIVVYLKVQKDFLKAQQILRVSQPAVTKGEKALRFGIVQQLQKLSLLGPTPEVRKKIIEQLSSLSQPEAWGSDGDVMAGLRESLALVASQSHSERASEATSAREALEGFPGAASAAQRIVGETFQGTPSDEERLFIQVRQFLRPATPTLLPGASSISPEAWEAIHAQLVSYYSGSDFPYVKSLFEGQLPRHVKDLECQLMLLEQKVVKQDKDKAGVEAPEDHIAKHHERRFEWVKTRIGSKDLFKKRSIRPGDPEKEINRILLTGDPGTGKTTLSRQLAYQWSQGLWGQEFHTLYLLPVRSVQQSEYDGTRYNREKTLSTAIVNTCFSHDLPATEDAYTSLRAHIDQELDKSTTLVILDGLDERAGASEEILRQAQAGTHKLLMLSRPYGIETERQRVDIEIEHVGFNRGQLRSYVQAEVSDGDRAAELLGYIQKHDNIRSIAHVPVNLQILCALWQDEGYDVREIAQQGSLPGLYRLVTDFTWQRYTKKWGLADESEEELFDTLGQIGLAALQKGEVLISPGIVHQHAKQETSKAKLKDAGFLLLQYVGEDADRKSGFYEFPHLTFQEYFAGRALAQQFLSKEEDEREEARKFISKHKYESQYGRTLSFMAGEVSRSKKAQGIKKLLGLLEKGDQELVGFQHLRLQLRVLHERLCMAGEAAEDELAELEDEFHVLDSLEKWFVRAFTHVRLEGYDAGRPGRDLLALLKSSLQTFGSIARHAPGLLDLFKKAAQGPHGAVRLAAVSSLGGALAGVDDEVRAMLQAMADDSHESRDIQWAAGEALSQATGAESTQDEAAVGAQGSLEGATESASQSPEDLLAQLRQAAKDARYEDDDALRSSRRSLLHAVAAATQEEFGALIDLLLPAAKDWNGFVRAAALEALLKAPLDALLAFYWFRPDFRLIPYITPRLYHTPLVIAQSVRSGPQRVLLYAAAGQAREWRHPQGILERFAGDVKGEVPQPIQVKAELSARIDKSVWEHYFGAVGEEPPLPADIDDILSRPCPFWDGKKVKKKVNDTHLLALIPSHVAGKPLTLDYLSELIKQPQGEGYGTKYRYYWDAAREAIGNQSPGKSYWVLMTRDVLDGSRNQRYEDQRKLVADHANRTGLAYEVPGILEAAVVMLLHHVRSGERLYSNSPNTYTRCQESVRNRQLVVGGFSSGGLFVRSYYFYDNFSDCGVAGLRKF